MADLIPVFFFLAVVTAWAVHGIRNTITKARAEYRSLMGTDQPKPAPKPRAPKFARPFRISRGVRPVTLGDVFANADAKDRAVHNARNRRNAR